MYGDHKEKLKELLIMCSFTNATMKKVLYNNKCVWVYKCPV